MRTPMLAVAGLAIAVMACTGTAVSGLRDDAQRKVARLQIDPAALSVAAGSGAPLVALAEDSAGAPVAGRSVSWASANSAVARVDGAGRVTGVTEGSTVVTATVDGVADTAAVTVTAATEPPVPPETPARTGWYVTPGGTSAGDGSAARPWDLATALRGASGRVQPGDTVWVRSGTYPNGGEMTVGGTATAYVTLSGYPGETAIIREQFESTASYVVIKDLVFEGPIDGATNQVYLHDCHHVVFTRNVIRNGDFHAGLSVDESHHMTITHNYIHDNGVDHSHDHGIYFKTTNGTGTVIANNLLVRNAARGLSLHDNSGVGVYDVVVAHNTIASNGSTGILVNDGDRITLVNNVAVGNGDETGQQQIRVLAGNSNKVWNNLTWHPTASSRRGIENTTASAMSGNLVADPLLAGTTASPADLRLRAGSPAIGRALVGWAFGPDYAGRARDGAPDIGAYEH